MANDSFLDKPRNWITDDRDEKKGTPHSIRDAGKAVKEGVKNAYNYTRDSIKAFPDQVDIENYKPEPTDPNNYRR